MLVYDSRKLADTFRKVRSFEFKEIIITINSEKCVKEVFDCKFTQILGNICCFVQPTT